MLFVQLSVLNIIPLMMSDSTQFCQCRRIYAFITGIINILGSIRLFARPFFGYSGAIFE